jgi:hypothetical protein
MADGGWRMANGEWRMADGEWRMADGEWRMANGESNPSFAVCYQAPRCGLSLPPFATHHGSGDAVTK